MDKFPSILLAIGLFLCVCLVSVEGQVVQKVWIDANPANTIFFDKTVVTVRFTGYDYTESSIVRISIKDAFTHEVKASYDASCRAGYYKFKMPNVSPTNAVIVASLALLRSGDFGKPADNSTEYAVGPYVARSVAHVQERYDPEDFWYYGDNYYRKAGQALWVHGYPTTLGSNANLIVNYTGVANFNHIMISLVADDSTTLNVLGYGYNEFVSFIKIGMPYSETGFIKLYTYDNDSDLELYYFTSENSYEFIADLTRSVARKEGEKNNVKVIRRPSGFTEDEWEVYQRKERSKFLKKWLGKKDSSSSDVEEE